MAVRRRRWLLRITPLLIGLVGMTISIIGGFTDTLYRLEARLWGVPKDYYPEASYIFVFLPISFFITIFGMLVVLVSLDSDENPPSANGDAH